MGQKIKLDDVEYDVEILSDEAKVTLSRFQFASSRIQELTNMQALLQRARNSYFESLKQEIISDKTGLIMSED